MAIYEGPRPNLYRISSGDFRLIAHRGNVTGPCEWENEPDYVREALNDGYDVELDVWLQGKDNIYLGHDKPQYKVTLDFLKDPRVWAHAKNKDAFEFLLKNEIHCFWHQTDDYTLTSKGYVWTYPGKPVLTKSVIVHLEKGSYDSYTGVCVGYCSDYLSKPKLLF